MALALDLLSTERKSLSLSLAQVLPLYKWIKFPALLLITGVLEDQIR